MATRQTAAAVATILLLLLAASTLSTAAAATQATSSRKLLHAGGAFCPWDAVKLGACVGVLGAVGLLESKCCQIVDGLVAAEAAACFCTTIKESVLGIPTEWTVGVGVGVLASACKTDLPDGFKCV
ncbi:hypothetical protein QOZ80_4BG0332630 [Eleusine coracana subsp. coracana]|nr:hypothetical protein QOZ80_4BG0332630 [Eleusine coracana subsp. coracana]